MFFLKKHTFASSGIFQDFTDYHCHLLPGVDDGVQTLEDTLYILSEYERLGIREVWLTPHIMEDIPNTTEALRTRFDELTATYTGSIHLHLAAENMLDPLFEERLQHNDLLPLGTEGDHLLVETSYYNPPIDLYGLLERIKQKGYHPVLAHPERYRYMQQADYRKLHAMGVKLQCNLPSFAGMYGKEARQKAQWILREWGTPPFMGTDLHSARQLTALLNARIEKRMLNILTQRNRNISHKQKATT